MSNGFNAFLADARFLTWRKWRMRKRQFLTSFTKVLRCLMPCFFANLLRRLIILMASLESVG